MLNKECLKIYILSFILGVICIIFIIMNINIQNELNEKDIIKTYKLKKNETMSNVIQIRKNDGTSCNISTIYDETTGGKKVTKKNGEACL
jgi:uncharacterized protein (UPF0333 family)